jgi:hypothetical protein
MAELYGIDNGGTGLSAATAKTVIELLSGSTASARICELWLSCDYVTIATPLFIKVELLTATSGTGTAYTPKRLNGEAQNRASVCTAKINDSVEPTSPTVFRTSGFVVPSGPLIFQFPLGREGMYLPPSTTMGVRLTCASAITNVYANLAFEE